MSSTAFRLPKTLLTCSTSITIIPPGNRLLRRYMINKTLERVNQPISILQSPQDPNPMETLEKFTRNGRNWLRKKSFNVIHKRGTKLMLIRIIGREVVLKPT
jgi:hypothetical protein